jgi:putative Holliday junction resolvase
MSRSRDRKQRGRDSPSPGELDFAMTPPGENASEPGAEHVRPLHPEGRVMALDVGGRRIGVAISDETRLIATPLQFVERSSNDITEIQELIERWNVGRVVVGLPTGLSGREGPQAAEVRLFTDALKRRITVPLEFWDERLTTAIAERSLIETGHRRAERRRKVDAVAAAVILQSYLDRQRLRRH